jgi:hypothetical protein
MNKVNSGPPSEAQSTRELRKLIYCIVGSLLLVITLDFLFGGVFSVMALSKLEILLLVGIYLVSRNNTALDRQVNSDWFLSTNSEVSIGWLHSKVTDLSWIGKVPFYLGLLFLLVYFLKEHSSESPTGIDGLFNQTTVSAVLLIYVISVLILRNAYLRLQLSRLESKPVEVTSESTEKEEVSNG